MSPYHICPPCFFLCEGDESDSFIFFSKQCEEYHKRYLILRNCREAPSPVADMFKMVGSLRRLRLSSISLYTKSSNRVQGDSTDRHCQKNQRLEPRAEGGMRPEKPNSLPDAWTQTTGAGSLDGQMRAVLKRQFLVSMTSPTQYRGPGYNKDKVLEDAIAQTPVGAIWDTSHPFAAALCKPWISLLTIVVLASISTNLALGVLAMAQNSMHEGSALRFTALDGSNASIRSLGFLRDSCAFESRVLPSTVARSAGALSVSYGQRISLNGWWFSIPLASASLTPKRFVVELWNGEVWRQVGSSSFQWTWSGLVLFFNGLFDVGNRHASAQTQVRDGELVVEFDMRLPGMWRYAKWITNLSLLSMAVAMVFVSRTKRQLQGRWYCAFFWLVAHVMELVACIVYTGAGETALALVSGIFAVSDLIYSLSLAFYESAYRHVNGLCGALYFGGVVAHYLYLDAPGMICGGYLCFDNRGIVEGFGLAMLCVSALVSRAASRREAERVIAEFRQAYERCWAVLLQSEEALDAVKGIGACAAALGAGTSRRILQRGRMPDSDADVGASRGAGAGDGQGGGEELHGGGDGGGIAQRTPPGPGRVEAPAPDGALILDLDQLFAQAEGVDVVLRHKVRGWAMASRGCFQADCPGGEVAFARWEKEGRDGAAAARVRWAAIKSRGRAIEKLYRSYNCDVARLLDCCRQSIYFEHPRDLLACLRAIAADAEARVVRVKNLLDPAWDAYPTGGYRNVALNLRLRTAETARLGIDAHVCELQLVTVDFARIKVRRRRRRRRRRALSVCAAAGRGGESRGGRKVGGAMPASRRMRIVRGLGVASRCHAGAALRRGAHRRMLPKAAQQSARPRAPPPPPQAPLAPRRRRGRVRDPRPARGRRRRRRRRRFRRRRPATRAT